jgi:hypothetical protein
VGVPFRTQIDGGEFQFVNCGPPSLIMSGFGLKWGRRRCATISTA